jgi:oxygen-independent coproporphyrinogen-3 oxidase
MAKQDGISFYAHIPFCSKLSWYCGCNVLITRDRSRGGAYVDTLLREFALYQEELSDCGLEELSLGGGSPNFLDKEDLRRLVRGVQELFPARENALLGIELDPRDTTEEQVRVLADIGFRRLSVGVQDFDEGVQDTINRHQSYEQTSELVHLARKEGFNSVGLDLVYGLPGQTEDSFAKTLVSVVAMEPDRIALFGYAHLPHIMRHQRLVERQPIPDIGARALLLTTAIHILCEAGYVRVGFDHFALPSDPLAKAAKAQGLHRNFQGFTVPKGGPLLACGVTGISDTSGSYWQNLTKLDEWEAAINAGKLPVARGLALSQDDKIRRHLINRLMCDSVVRFKEMEDCFGIDFPSYFSYELGQFEDEKYAELAAVDLEEGTIVPTRIGFELIRNLCMVFDSHLRGAKPSGSTTI